MIDLSKLAPGKYTYMYTLSYGFVGDMKHAPITFGSFEIYPDELIEMYQMHGNGD